MLHLFKLNLYQKGKLHAEVPLFIRYRSRFLYLNK